MMIQGAGRILASYALYEVSTRISEEVASKVAKVSLICLQVILFCSLPILSGAGLCIGFILDKQVQGLAKKIDILINSCRSFQEKFFLYLIGGGLSLYYLPYSVNAITFYYASKWGAYVTQSSLRRYNEYVGLPNNDPIISVP